MIEDEYPSCDICKSIIYRFDKTCMRCLIKESEKTIENSDKLLEELKKDLDDKN